MSDRPSTLVIFGATGDLAQRKLIPALFNQYLKGQLPNQFYIVGFSIEDYTTDALRQRYVEGLRQYTAKTFDDTRWDEFCDRIRYVQGNLTEADDFRGLEEYLQDLETDDIVDRLYYLAIAPRFIEPTIHNLGVAGMHNEDKGARKIIIEKPFGNDLETASALNEVVHRVFNESQIYRIDHYLGKETAQNILFFRFANHVFESVWSREHIDNVQITVAESVDVGHRAGYYDQAGVMRDMIQNHLLQLLTLTAMEPPSSFSADELRNEKVKVLKSIRQIALEDAVRGQYEGYRFEEGVADESITPTFTAFKVYVDNWRWQGVPFYLRSGKALKTKASQIAIEFKHPPRMMFNLDLGKDTARNVLTLCIQPDEGIHFQFETKVPAETIKTEIVEMEWHYQNAFGEDAIPEAYERLLVDALNGDASLFIRSDEIEQAWRIVDPVIKAWEANKGNPLQIYHRGSWGPSAADDLLSESEFIWQMGCLHD
ncbi:MAG: glucose-6-phosphate dehydrogenase [Chloroflexota bacterium]